MMIKATPFVTWPWEKLGIFKVPSIMIHPKNDFRVSTTRLVLHVTRLILVFWFRMKQYVLFLPLVGRLLHSRLRGDDTLATNWCFHVLFISILRFHLYMWYTNVCNMLFLTRTRRILPQGLDFKQIDKEWDWDNFVILQAMIASLFFPDGVTKLGMWESRGVIGVVVLHVVISEPIYYFVHRWLHRNYIFTHYHSFNHSSTVPQPVTAGSTTFLEQLLLAVVIGLPILGCCLAGYGSIIMIYCYVLVFDFLRCIGYSNVEIFPHQIFDSLPFLRFLLYTPSYYSLHHKEMNTNYCLFMPLNDALWSTLNKNSWDLQKKISVNATKAQKGPDFVFLAHVIDITSSMHVPFSFRSFSTMPYNAQLFLVPYWPLAFVTMLIMWSKAKTFLLSFYNLRGKLHQTWVVPRFGFQYFLPFAKDGINKHIEEGILRADKLGVKVISLAALNKNEALNGGGMMFVKKHPNLNVRVVHGNTLTAAIILNEIHEDVKEVFLIGATSKIGRAIALYLCRRGVQVLMLTQSLKRFHEIQQEAPTACQNNMVHVTKYQAAKDCKTWIAGKWITPRQQGWAPSGTHFHQFVVPPILAFRRDCTYSNLAAMKLPEDVQGLGSCEYMMERGVVHACHAGGVVHFLEGWSHHEVGALDVDQIDVVWKAALKHGLKPVTP